MSDVIQRLKELSAKATKEPWFTNAGHVYSPGAEGANVCSVSDPRATRGVGYDPLTRGTSEEAFDEAYANRDLIAYLGTKREALIRCIEALDFAAQSLAGIASVNMQNPDYKAKLRELAEWRLDAMLSLKTVRSALAGLEEEQNGKA